MTDEKMFKMLVEGQPPRADGALVKGDGYAADAFV